MLLSPKALAKTFATLAVAALAAACGSDADDSAPGSSPGPAETAVASPTERPSPSPADTPEPPSATPMAGAYELVTVIPDGVFWHAVDFEPLPGSDTEGLIMTQEGMLYRARADGQGEVTVFADLTAKVRPDFGTEEGFLGLAFSPEFEADGAVYIYYTPAGPRRTQLSRFRLVDGALDPASEEALLEIEQFAENHNGGQLAFGPDGYLYIGVGDGGGGGDPQDNGQNVGTLLGKILRIDVSGGGPYRIPPDNPFVGQPGARPEIYAYGLRNPWRFTFDRETGDLWAGDVGQNSWEEVDRIVAGGNYGWNIMEGFACYLGPPCDQVGLQLPRAAYSHDDGECSVIGGYVYHGQAMPELRGWLIYADYCNGKVWALNARTEDPAVLLTDSEHQITSFAELPDGELRLVTFDRILALQRRP